MYMYSVTLSVLGGFFLQDKILKCKFISELLTKSSN